MPVESRQDRCAPGRSLPAEQDGSLSLRRAAVLRHDAPTRGPPRLLDRLPRFSWAASGHSQDLPGSPRGRDCMFPQAPGLPFPLPVRPGVRPSAALTNRLPYPSLSPRGFPV